MDEKEKRTIHEVSEWTVEWIMEQFSLPNCSTFLVNAHNAALATERENTAFWKRKAGEEFDAYRTLLEQRAADREKHPAASGEWTAKHVKEMCQFTASDFKLIADAHNAALAAAVAYERQLRPAWDKINQLKDEIKELMGNKMTEGDCQIVIGALDSLGVALADKKHQWTEGERAIYEKAIEIALGIGRREPPTQAFTVEINGEDVLFVRLDDHNAALAGKSLESSKELLMERDELKQQLAEAEAAIVRWSVPQTDTTALDAAIAEARQPLVQKITELEGRLSKYEQS
jgi:hypothetical protein